MIGRVSYSVVVKRQRCRPNDRHRHTALVFVSETTAEWAVRIGLVTSTSNARRREHRKSCRIYHRHRTERCLASTWGACHILTSPSSGHENRSTALEGGGGQSTTALHGEYRQDKRALRGARASPGGDRGEGWQAEADADPEDAEAGGARAITLSSLPRGYWATLFNLEVVKARNRPIEPPKKPEAAPFFLTTVHKGGEVAPSFPEMGTIAAAGTAAASAPAAAAAVGDGKSRVGGAEETVSGGNGVEDEEVPDLPSGGGGDAWSDDDDDAEGDGEGAEAAAAEEGGDEVGRKRRLGGGTEEASSSPPAAGAVAPKSKILKQIKSSARLGGGGPSRCKLADLLLECEQGSLAVDDMDEEDDEEEEERGSRKRHPFGAVMTYLKTLAPPMVDVEMSLLCQGDWDEDGVHLVALAVQFLLGELRWAIVLAG